MPILLIVQVATGSSTYNVQKTVTKLQARTEPIVLDTIITTGYDPEGVNYDPAVSDLIRPDNPENESSLTVASKS